MLIALKTGASGKLQHKRRPGDDYSAAEKSVLLSRRRKRMVGSTEAPGRDLGGLSSQISGTSATAGTVRLSPTLFSPDAPVRSGLATSRKSERRRPNWGGTLMGRKEMGELMRALSGHRYYFDRRPVSHNDLFAGVTDQPAYTSP